MSAIPPGWYPEPAEPSVVRYWDGAQWTNHVQPAPQTALVEEGPRITNRGAVGVVLALIAALTVLFLVFGNGSDGPGDSFSDQDALSLDADAKAGVRTAQTAIETYSTDHDSSYAGATPEELRAIESTLPETVAVTADVESYTVTVESETGNTFSIVRDAGGQVSYSCATVGEGGCPDSGNWVEQ